MSHSLLFGTGVRIGKVGGSGTTWIAPGRNSPGKGWLIGQILQ
jgi:hypothetical protein